MRCFGSSSSVPGGRWDHCLDPGLASFNRNVELDVVQWNGRSHGVCVVFVVYPQVRVGGVAPPAQRQVQGCGLDALC